MIRGFCIGRFQPYHNGHDKIIRTISNEVDELVIGIGSAQKSHSVKDPFTAGERIEMIRKSLEDIDLLYYIIPLQDLEFNSLWVSHVRSLSPKFQVVYSNNPLVIQLFKEAGADVRSTPLHDRKRLSGTEIRKLMVEGDTKGWKKLVPSAVADVIEEINGIERIKAVASTDNKYSL
ncbi:MAG: nicotinamide-nucleotide adenylyltransferase [Methanosarcinaceae archaeon]|nr:nicotinamide-nucleotide adenylyltransferase [Methanosarcinaceae archaeon]